MVKIRVTGESTFDWIEAKYHKDRANYPAHCKEQATFSEDCFDGTLVEQINYDVDLVAIPQENGKRKREISKYCFLNKPMIFNLILFQFINIFKLCISLLGKRETCVNTEGWTTGTDCQSQGFTNNQGCTETGWTCYKYSKKVKNDNGKVMAAWCGNGAPLSQFKEKAEKGQWPFGPDNNSPEDNCCECGKGKFVLI